MPFCFSLLSFLLIYNIVMSKLMIDDLYVFRQRKVGNGSGNGKLLQCLNLMMRVVEFNQGKAKQSKASNRQKHLQYGIFIIYFL